MNLLPGTIDGRRPCGWPMAPACPCPTGCSECVRDGMAVQLGIRPDDI